MSNTDRVVTGWPQPTTCPHCKNVVDNFYTHLHLAGWCGTRYRLGLDDTAPAKRKRRKKNE